MEKQKLFLDFVHVRSSSFLFHVFSKVVEIDPLQGISLFSVHLELIIDVVFILYKGYS